MAVVRGIGGKGNDGCDMCVVEVAALTTTLCYVESYPEQIPRLSARSLTGEQKW